MSKTPVRIPDAIKAALMETGMPWAAEVGKKHVKYKLLGKLVGISPLNGRENAPHSAANVVAQIRRTARALSS